MYNEGFDAEGFWEEVALRLKHIEDERLSGKAADCGAPLLPRQIPVANYRLEKVGCAHAASTVSLSTNPAHP